MATTVGRHTTKRKTKLMKYLPKAASAVTFQNPIFSPGRENKQRLYSSSGFSGPIISIIPDEARRRPRRGASGAVDDDDCVDGLGSTQEPSSPKVSCIGQIKLHKEKKKKKKKKKEEKMIVVQRNASQDWKEEAKGKKKGSKILKMFGVRSSRMSKSKVEADGGGSTKSEAAPSLGHMRRYASGRQSLANFDWTAQIAPVNDMEERDCHSDEEFGRYGDEEEEDDDDDDVIIPFSAPIVMGMGMGRREVNLWQRRNTTTPPPLHLKTNQPL